MIRMGKGRTVFKLVLDEENMEGLKKSIKHYLSVNPHPEGDPGIRGYHVDIEILERTTEIFDSLIISINGILLPDHDKEEAELESLRLEGFDPS